MNGIGLKISNLRPVADNRKITLQFAKSIIIDKKRALNEHVMELRFAYCN